MNTIVRMSQISIYPFVYLSISLSIYLPVTGRLAATDLGPSETLQNMNYLLQISFKDNET